MECNCELAGQWEAEVFQTFTQNTSIFIIDLYVIWLINNSLLKHQKSNESFIKDQLKER